MNIDNEIKNRKDKAESARKKLLLHSCCAPCFAGCIERAASDFEVTVFFSNDNLSPEEYEKRLLEQIRFLAEFSPEVKIIAEKHCPDDFISASSGLESEIEGGKRCESCIRLRLEKAADYALKENYDFFATTLTVSPRKNALLINSIGKAISEKTGAAYLPTDFKKKNGYLRSLELSKEYNLYRQNYCGCVFSKR